MNTTGHTTGHTRTHPQRSIRDTPPPVRVGVSQDPKTGRPHKPQNTPCVNVTNVKSGRYKEANPVYRGQWRTIRRTILQRDNHTCQIGLPGCQTNATCVDHIQPVSLGGEWYAEENLRASCAQCNAELAKIAARVKRQQTPGNPNVNINGITTVASRRW